MPTDNKNAKVASQDARDKTQGIIKKVESSRTKLTPVGIYFEQEKLNTPEIDNLRFQGLFEAMCIKESKQKHKQVPFSQHVKHRGYSFEGVNNGR